MDSLQNMRTITLEKLYSQILPQINDIQGGVISLAPPLSLPSSLPPSLVKRVRWELYNLFVNSKTNLSYVGGAGDPEPFKERQAAIKARKAGDHQN